ncbi:MAG: CYTH domain-containing protein [Ruminococcaceae bacterium]|nr:CYTH domain-containing protein [Oscillospiraceae bacterium]
MKYSGLEKEAKVLLEEKDYLKLIDVAGKCSIFSDKKSIFQVNYYYDTEDFWGYTTGNTFRVRQKENRLELQRKVRQFAEESGNVHICREFGKEIKELPKSITVDGNEGKLELQLIGNLSTFRNEFIFEDIVVSLDKNIYLGIVDFELEIEYRDENKLNILPEEFRKFLDYDVNPIGKYPRFKEKMLSLKNVIS